MPQHISIRVPWHDHGWDGTVCADPVANNACLRLKSVAEGRDDRLEASICGRCMAEHANDLPCLSEGAAFMSPREMAKTTIHPYKQSNPRTHGHFLPTEVVYPAYSFPARPFAWLMRKNIEQWRDACQIDYRPEREPVLGFKTNWVQDAENHRAIFDYFYADVEEERSLCIAYAKQVPFVEDARRVVIGVGRVKRIVPAVEHRREGGGGLRSMVWETMICHSIREDNRDGFVIPYREMMDYARTHPEFDMASVAVFAPRDAFDEFSYATEHVSYDAVIDVLQSCIQSFTIINACLDRDYSNVLEWLNRELAQVWEDRGAFPGFGAMLCALGIPQGILVSKRMQEDLTDGEDLWARMDATMAEPAAHLPSLLAGAISPILQGTWERMPAERRELFQLLSRFSLTIDQAEALFHGSERSKRGLSCSDREILENPYLVYEQTRLKQDSLYISVRKVDRAVFPVASIQEKYPLAAPSALTSENDERRVRAIAIAALEAEAQAGNTILPCDLAVEEIRGMVLDPACRVTGDILNAIDPFLSQQILHRRMKNGDAYYKLARLNAFDEIIERRVSKRLRARKLEVRADWREMLDAKLDRGGAAEVEAGSLEERARREKSAILEELSRSRIGVLVGDAGTGKTTVLSVLCSHPDIKAGGVLLLAPTGKATVRMMDSMGREMEGLTAQNVAQFLVRSGRFDWDEMRYKLSDTDFRDVPETVIIDEASMLTEEMFGALMQALKAAKRILFVGDPNQLPPIGAGRPFVDLVALLKSKLKPNRFPRVCDSYGELTVNCRQGGSGRRADVEFARLFTGMEDRPDRDVVAEMQRGGCANISFVRWFEKEDLEERLLEIVARETGMRGVDDQAGFDASLGGERGRSETFFNRGCAGSAEGWQILAPVRDMPQGVLHLNRLLHVRYREHFLALAKQRGAQRRIPQALGPEGIVYGDKVINVINGAREAWPKGAGRNYVANGEIGIACSSYAVGKPEEHGGARRALDYLRVEFSSQRGALYSYTKRDFNEESGSASLELAYALTVHKAQGSQFHTVILVLAEPCGILSREMLYTALTRQVERVIVLYNQDAYHLLKYASEEHSDIARRFTDLFAGVLQQDGPDMRPQIVRVGGGFYEDRLIHRTARGELVRSKSEVVIANALFYHHLDYVYEPELVLEGVVRRPDFQVVDDDTGETWYWEHCGMMENPQYRERWSEKRELYRRNGIEEGRNLIVTFDEGGALDAQKVEQIIAETFDS